LYEFYWGMVSFIRRIRARLGAAVEMGTTKATHEFAYWQSRYDEEGILTNSHYEYFYTAHFGLQKEVFLEKKILDVGCGPRGSLEWATTASVRVGLDPLAESYRRLGTETHATRYVAASVERIPFRDGCFDFVSSFNSLDHVDHLEETINEIGRVTASGGTFLLLTEVGHSPTDCEPQVFSFDVVKRFAADFELVQELHYEKSKGGMYESILKGLSYDHRNGMSRYGIVSAKFHKR
jgi:ubiquinone/menaquinone biosynthesis C-methylase UbiE